MKTFAETLNEIKKNKDMNEAQKRNALINLGVCPNEIYAIFNFWRKEEAALFKSPLTFGVEIECYNVIANKLCRAAERNGIDIWDSMDNYNHRDSMTNFKVMRDSSLDGNDTLECVSPVLSDEAGFKALEAICAELNAQGAKVNKSCGLHVHIGVSHLNGWQYVSIYENYRQMEEVIDSFMAQSRRADNNGYCKSLKNKNFSQCDNMADVQSLLIRDRYYKVNCMAYDRHKTIEFRQHGGTTDYNKISHWVRFCQALVEWSMTNRLDHTLTSIEEIPFLSDEEYKFFKARQIEIARKDSERRS